jgi:hypothetical protein
VNENGYGNPHGTINRNTSWNMRSTLVTHEDVLYVGTWNWEGNAQIFRTNGVPQQGDSRYVWEEVSPPGFGESHIIAQPLTVFQGYLFASSSGPGGVRLWALPLNETGVPLSTVWVCVVADGFGQGERTQMIPSAYATEGTLYVGTGTLPLTTVNKRPELWALTFQGTLDTDGDGFAGGAFADCDDGNPAVNPAMTEVWGNGIDDDCDPSTWDVPVFCGTLILRNRSESPPRVCQGALRLFLVLAIPAVMIRVMTGRRPGR